MSESEANTFVVLITIVLPDAGEETVFEVLLTPADSLSLPNGSTKTLQDCTVADLQQFARQIEEDSWNSFQDETLLDLSLEDDVSISVIRVDEEDTAESAAALWMEHMVILEDQSSPFYRSLWEKAATRISFSDRSQMGEDKEDDELTDEHPDEEPVIHEPVLKAEIADIDQENGSTELDELRPEKEGKEPILAPEDGVEELYHDIEVAVSEVEAVYEEREISEPHEAIIDIEKPDFRILGRRRPLEHPTWTAADILINEPAFRDAQAHSISSLDREVAGVLVGPPPEKQPDGRYVVHISDTIIAKHTKMQGASVTYTPESWRYVNDKLADLYPEDSAVIVGWYHTHPGFGIFLSTMDQFIHHNFFTQKWHVAYVLDPIAQRSGFFCWDRNQVKVDRYEFPWPEWADNSW
jgi:proteasome lid subunit RPN8/RPN11